MQFFSAFRISIRAWLLRLCLLVIPMLPGKSGFCQHFPEPALVSPGEERSCLLQLAKQRQDTQTLKALLKLGSIIYFKPFKTKQLIKNGQGLAKRALNLSQQLQHTTIQKQATLLSVIFLTEDTAFTEAEQLVSTVADPDKIDLALVLAFRYIRRGQGKATDNHHKALQWAQLARDLSRQLGLPAKELWAKQLIGNAQAELGEKAATDQLLEVVEQSKTANGNRAAYAYNMLSRIKFVEGDHTKALYYSDQCVKSMLVTGDTLRGGDFYYWHGNIYYIIGQHDESIALEKKAIASYVNHPGKQNRLYEAVGIACAAMRKQRRSDQSLAFMLHYATTYPPRNNEDSAYVFGQLFDVYRDLKNYPLAEKYLWQALNTYTQHHTLNWTEYRSIAQFYVESGQFQKAKPYLDKAFTFPLSKISLRHQAHLHYMRFLADSALGNLPAAIRHLQKNIQLNDTIYKAAKTEATEKLLVQFETAKKQDSLKMKDQAIRLIQQQQLLERTQLKRSVWIRNVSLGGLFLVLVILALLYNRYRLKNRNQALIEKKNDALQHLVREKEWLLKEVHHRVKNNLQTVVSLLELQSETLKEEALSAIQKSQDRIYAISLLHQKLYSSSNVASVNIRTYLADLLGYLKDIYATTRVELSEQVQDIELDISQAIPLGLIVNEAVTNAIKYGRDVVSETVAISVACWQREAVLELTVSDNGCGFVPAEVDPQEGLGLQLIRALVGELEGTLSLETAGGTHLKVRFNPDVPFSREQGEQFPDLAGNKKY